jgi:hypothetical protein
MKVLHTNDAEMFMVKQDESSGDIFLNVVVGGIGMYEIEKKMTKEMVDAFHRSPNELLPFVKEIRHTGTCS